MILVSLFAVGIGAGILGAMLGLGGGIFLVPALTLGFKFPLRIAVATSLVAVIATSAGVASVSRPGRGADIGLGLRLETATTTGALAGSLIAGYLSQQVLYLLFAAITLATAGYSYWKVRRAPKAASDAAVEALFRAGYRPSHWATGLGLSGLAGVLSGLTGIGGGFIKTPVMYSIMDVPLGVATATSNFMVGITATASAVVYQLRGDVRPLVAVPTAAGVFLGAIAGARLAPRVRVGTLRTALIVVLIALGIQMAWRGFTGG